VTVNWSVGGTMDHPAYAGRVETTVRNSGWATSSTSFNTVSDLSGGNITIMRSTSIIFIACHLSVETDGASVGHGVARLQRSYNDGDWQAITQFNVCGSTDNLVGDGFHYRHDHNQSAGTDVKYRVQYRKGNTSGNHTVADQGPGYATVASLIYWEMQE
tara:strand:- start:858 stop:1334 length:477 start_codon:yes stop_codon:yes gene_type:complete